MFLVEIKSLSSSELDEYVHRNSIAPNASLKCLAHHQTRERSRSVSEIVVIVYPTNLRRNVPSRPALICISRIIHWEITVVRVRMNVRILIQSRSLHSATNSRQLGNVFTKRHKIAALINALADHKLSAMSNMIVDPINVILRVNSRVIAKPSCVRSIETICQIEGIERCIGFRSEHP